MAVSFFCFNRLLWGRLSRDPLLFLQLSWWASAAFSILLKSEIDSCMLSKLIASCYSSSNVLRLFLVELRLKIVIDNIHNIWLYSFTKTAWTKAELILWKKRNFCRKEFLFSQVIIRHPIYNSVFTTVRHLSWRLWLCDMNTTVTITLQELCTVHVRTHALMGHI